MDWSRPVDLYCERPDPSFWAEPVNALTNAAFVVAAIVAFLEWRKGGRRDWPALVLIGVTFAIGIGSFIFHTVATRGAALFDTVPIAIFIYGYLWLALRRFFGLANWKAIALVVAFAAASYAETAIVPRGALNGSHAYIPAYIALVVVGWLATAKPQRQLLLSAAMVFAVSIFFRTIDHGICPAVPLGTHFLWHTLNGVVLYLLLRAAIVAGAGTSLKPL